MNIEQDGSLGLGIIDLCEEFRDDVPDPVRFRHFSGEANIAAAYALAMKHSVRFATPGRLQDVEGVPHHSLVCAENVATEEQGACLTEKEEADLVIRHMGWFSLWKHIIISAKILFGTKIVDYKLSVDPECGHSVRSSLVINPNIRRSEWSHDKIRERRTMLHDFIRKSSHELSGMTVVCVSYEADPKPADNPADVDSEKEE